jgi:hypothetical protein
MCRGVKVYLSPNRWFYERIESVSDASPAEIQTAMIGPVLDFVTIFRRCDSSNISPKVRGFLSAKTG